MQNAQSIFKLHSDYQPTGDQPQAIEALVKGFKEGNQCQTLLGVPGSGKTFTMAMDLITLYGEMGLPYIIMSDEEIEEELDTVSYLKEVMA